MKLLYRGAPDRAYAAMDFEGTGQITEERFIAAMGMSSLKENEIREFLRIAGLNGMNFDHFKKVFFPYLYLI